MPKTSKNGSSLQIFFVTKRAGKITLGLQEKNTGHQSTCTVFCSGAKQKCQAPQKSDVGLQQRDLILSVLRSFDFFISKISWNFLKCSAGDSSTSRAAQTLSKQGFQRGGGKHWNATQRCTQGNHGGTAKNSQNQGNLFAFPD